LNGISDISRHSEVSDIRSFTDSNSYHMHKETDVVNLNARGRDCERLALYTGNTLFIYSKKEVVGQCLIFDESEALYICISRDSEYVNFGDKNGIAFYFNLTPYVTTNCFLPLSIGCILFVRGRSRESNSTP